MAARERHENNIVLFDKIRDEYRRFMNGEQQQITFELYSQVFTQTLDSMPRTLYITTPRNIRRRPPQFLKKDGPYLIFDFFVMRSPASIYVKVEDTTQIMIFFVALSFISTFKLTNTRITMKNYDLNRDRANLFNFNEFVTNPHYVEINEQSRGGFITWIDSWQFRINRAFRTEVVMIKNSSALSNTPYKLREAYDENDQKHGLFITYFVSKDEPTYAIYNHGRLISDNPRYIEDTKKASSTLRGINQYAAEQNINYQSGLHATAHSIPRLPYELILIIDKFITHGVDIDPEIDWNIKGKVT